MKIIKLQTHKNLKSFVQLYLGILHGLTCFPYISCVVGKLWYSEGVECSSKLQWYSLVVLVLFSANFQGDERCLLCRVFFGNILFQNSALEVYIVDL